MLRMKSHCERCGIAVPATGPAVICSLESTFCPACGQALQARCPSCGGELTARPRRSFDPPGAAESLGQRLLDQFRELTQPRDQPWVSVERLMPAPPSSIFDVLASPARHAEFDGSQTVQGQPLGPERLEPGSRFTMGMRVQGVSYRSVNTVIDFEEGRRIAWQTYGEIGGRRIVGGQIWRFELEERPDATLVRHTYDWSEAMAAKLVIEMLGFPERFERTGPLSLERLERAALSQPG